MGAGSDRAEPHRVFLWHHSVSGQVQFLGLGQSFADGIKMFAEGGLSFSEHRSGFVLAAPIVMMVVIVVSIAVIPWGDRWGANIRISTSPKDRCGERRFRSRFTS